MSESNIKALRSRRVITPNGEIAATIIVAGERIESIESHDYDGNLLINAELVDLGNNVLMPGLVDTHVHINEPGRTDWEGFDTATHAACAGGITTLVDMPLNCSPVTTTVDALNIKLNEITDGKKLWVDCGFWGGITSDNLDDLEALTEAGILGAKSFTCHSGLDEFPSVNEAQMKQGMRIMARAQLPYLVHAEMDGNPDAIIDHSYQSFLDSRPKSLENNAIAMVVRVMREIKAEGLEPLAHIVHLSSAEALPLIRAAQQEGLQLTAETCPHYLTLNSEAIPDGKTVFKCCPPIREDHNRQLLWAAIEDGTISKVVSDHSPCTPQLKHIDSGDLEAAWGGISALQFGLPLIWSEGRTRGFSLVDIARLMCSKPAEFASMGHLKGSIEVGKLADFCVFDDTAAYVISTEMIKHKHKISPYVGTAVRGSIIETWLRGECIYRDDNYLGEASGQHLLKGSF
ncbi:allantoinase [Sinobacterium caligoides]|uniref:allantoinase n=1 Tax=Sinobacterium caligoides TaxID=933926 RepID=A0A3N2E0L9_9GAMM|nr:allantoinase AllB [Sinobacterium caligoides]ROS05638.1 allantoinase [Sinobacterium caligoides]